MFFHENNFTRTGIAQISTKRRKKAKKILVIESLIKYFLLLLRTRKQPNRAASNKKLEQPCLKLMKSGMLASTVDLFNFYLNVISSNSVSILQTFIRLHMRKCIHLYTDTVNFLFSRKRETANA